MPKKKFKTVAGYLRSTDDGLRSAKPGSDAERAQERQIINALLPQVGIPQTIAASETPREGVDRIKRLTTDPRQSKALADCERWLDGGHNRWTVTSGAMSTVTHGMIFRGVDYTQEETEALEAMCRERKISMQEAIAIMRNQDGSKSAP